MLMGVFKAVMYMYILYKFIGRLSGSYAVNVAQLCMQASISTRVNSSPAAARLCFDTTR